MGHLKEPERAILFTGLLYHDEHWCDRAIEGLVQLWGPVVFVTEPMPWEHSEYYREELGWPIHRRFVLFDRLVDPSEIVEFKLQSNALEQRLSVQGKRTVNIDPGYITLSKLVLATTKNYAHRVYLGKGIYAEVTLYYIKGSFVPHRFTYQDYATEAYIAVFERMRQHLKQRIDTPPEAQ